MRLDVLEGHEEVLRHPAISHLFERRYGDSSIGKIFIVQHRDQWFVERVSLIAARALMAFIGHRNPCHPEQQSGPLPLEDSCFFPVTRPQICEPRGFRLSGQQSRIQARGDR